MGEITPAASGAPASAGGQSKYRATQQKLKAITQDMDQFKRLMEQLQQRIEAAAERAKSASARAHDSEFDAIPVGLATAVAIALRGMGQDAGIIVQMSGKVTGKADEAQRTHQRLYERLDNVRSRRTARTPKPGAFVQRP